MSHGMGVASKPRIPPYDFAQAPVTRHAALDISRRSYPVEFLLITSHSTYAY